MMLYIITLFLPDFADFKNRYHSIFRYIVKISTMIYTDNTYIEIIIVIKNNGRGYIV